MRHVGAPREAHLCRACSRSQVNRAPPGGSRGGGGHGGVLSPGDGGERRRPWRKVTRPRGLDAAGPPGPPGWGCPGWRPFVWESSYTCGDLRSNVATRCTSPLPASAQGQFPAREAPQPHRLRPPPTRLWVTQVGLHNNRWPGKNNGLAGFF